MQGMMWQTTYCETDKVEKRRTNGNKLTSKKVMLILQHKTSEHKYSQHIGF